MNQLIEHNPRRNMKPKNTTNTSTAEHDPRRIKFCTELIVITSNVKEELPPEEVREALDRHFRGDWGDLCKSDREQNEAALEHGDRRFFSAYHTQAGTRFWIITEWDRSITTVLLPADY